MTARARAALIAVGSELLGTLRTDTNSLWLTEKLEAIGIPVVRKVCVGDSREEISSLLTAVASRASLVLLTGGLGPTDDDVTREAVAQFLGRRLLMDDESLSVLRARFERRGIEMPSINEKQALVIEGSRPLPNPLGSAPGAWVEDNGHIIALMPGVPAEMRKMFEEQIFPELSRRFGSAGRHHRVLRIAAMGESAVEERVRGVYARWPGYDFTILASVGEVQLHLTAGGEITEARETLDSQTRDFEKALPGGIFGADGETLESVVGSLLRRTGKTVAVAESCTGGGLAERLTRVAGASDYFLGGVVSYSDEVKKSLLAVPEETLARFGAVSEQTALAMAVGARERFGADFALATTGIAGPAGATPEKPVGMVWIALAAKDGPARAKVLRLPGNRAMVRGWAGAAALEMLRRRLLETLE